MNTTFITNNGKKYVNIKKCIPITDREYILRLFNHFVIISVYELGLPTPNCSKYALLCQYVSNTISVTRAINTNVSITDRYRFIPADIFSHLIMCFIYQYPIKKLLTHKSSCVRTDLYHGASNRHYHIQDT